MLKFLLAIDLAKINSCDPRNIMESTVFVDIMRKAHAHTLRSMLARAKSVWQLPCVRPFGEYLALDLRERQEVLGRSNRRFQQLA